MEVLNEFLKTKGIYSLVMILFFLGVYGMVLSKNYMKKLMEKMERWEYLTDLAERIEQERGK